MDIKVLSSISKQKNGIDIYGYHFEEEVTIGLPEIYGYKDGQVIIFDHNGDYLGVLSEI